MDHDVDLVGEPDDDPLPDAADRRDLFPADLSYRRIDRPEDERIEDLQAYELATENTCLERLDVHGDVWKLWHARNMATARPRSTRGGGTLARELGDRAHARRLVE